MNRPSDMMRQMDNFIPPNYSEREIPVTTPTPRQPEPPMRTWVAVVWAVATVAFFSFGWNYISYVLLPSAGLLMFAALCLIGYLYFESKGRFQREFNKMMGCEIPDRIPTTPEALADFDERIRRGRLAVEVPGPAKEGETEL